MSYADLFSSALLIISEMRSILSCLAVAGTAAVSLKFVQD